MKKVLFAIILSVLFTSGLQAQGDLKFGVTGGLINSNADVGFSVLGLVDLGSVNAISKTGFYVGVIADIGISEKFHLQPELTYASAGDLSYIHIPIMVKYYVINKLYAQAGPQLSFSSNIDGIKGAIQDIEGVLGTNGDVDDVLNTIGVDLGFGLGYDILDNLSAQIRYSTELTNRYTGPLNNSLKVRASNVNVGIAYFF